MPICWSFSRLELESLRLHSNLDQSNPEGHVCGVMVVIERR